MARPHHCLVTEKLQSMYFNVLYAYFIIGPNVRSNYDKPSSRLPLVSAKLAVTFQGSERHLGWYLFILLGKQRYVCEQLALGCCVTIEWPRIKQATSRSPLQHPTVAPHS